MIPTLSKLCLGWHIPGSTMSVGLSMFRALTSNLWQVLLSISYSPLYTISTGSVQLRVFRMTCRE